MRIAILKSMSIAALSLLLAGASQAQVKLAVAGPVTGANAAFGAQLTQGVQQAAEDINKAGGIMGQKIEVEIGDDVSDPKQGCRSRTSSSAIRSSEPAREGRSSGVTVICVFTSYDTLASVRKLTCQTRIRG
jgi:hypothetical protein